MVLSTFESREPASGACIDWLVTTLASLLPEPVGGMVEQHGARLLRFGAVGASGVLIDMLLLYALVAAAGMPKIPAAAIAAEISILSNFALNDRWTFRDCQQATSCLRRALQYNACTLVGELMALPVLATLSLGLGVHYMIANFFAMGAAAMSNYVLNSRFTWSGASLAPVPVEW